MVFLAQDLELFYLQTIPLSWTPDSYTIAFDTPAWASNRYLNLAHLKLNLWAPPYPQRSAKPTEPAVFLRVSGYDNPILKLAQLKNLEIILDSTLFSHTHLIH